MGIDTTLGHESNTTLRVTRLVFREVFEFVVLQLIVPDVTVTGLGLIFKHPSLWTLLDLPSAGQVQALCSFIPEGHAHTGDRVERLEATNWFTRGTDIPQCELTVTHLGEPGGRDPVTLTQPDNTTVLGTRMPLCLVGRALLTRIPYPQLLVSRGSGEEGTVGAPGHRLYHVAQFQGELGSSSLNIPHLDRKVARSRGKNIFSGRVEKRVSDFPGTMRDEQAVNCCGRSSRLTSDDHSAYPQGQCPGHHPGSHQDGQRNSPALSRGRPNSNQKPVSQLLSQHNAPLVATETPTYLSIIGGGSEQVIVERVPDSGYSLHTPRDQIVGDDAIAHQSVSSTTAV